MVVVVDDSEGVCCLFIPSFYITGYSELSIRTQLTCFPSLLLSFALLLRAQNYVYFSHLKIVISIIAITLLHLVVTICICGVAIKISDHGICFLKLGTPLCQFTIQRVFKIQCDLAHSL